MSNYRYGWNGYLQDNLDIVLKEAIPNKWDALFLLIGKEGTGKSTLGTQLATYCNKNFKLDDCVFTPEQFNDRLNSCPDESSILWDEAITGADVDKHASLVSQTIITNLTQIRKKKLKIFLCFPYLYKLNKYFISRCLGSFYVTAKDFDDRGYVKFFSANRTEVLYDLIKEKYKYAYKKVMRTARGGVYSKFNQTFELDEIEYEKKKDAARVKDEKLSKAEQKWRVRFMLLVKKLKKDERITYVEVAKIIGAGRQAITELMSGRLDDETSISYKEVKEQLVESEVVE